MLPSFLATLLIGCSSLIGTIFSYRILAVCPTPASSHQIVFHAIIRALADRGHELVALTANPIEIDNPNVTQINLSGNHQSRFAYENYIRLRGLDLLMMGLKELPWIMEQTMKHPDVQSILERHNETFDAVIAEYIGLTPLYALAEYFNTTFIGYSSVQADANQHEALGHPVHPVLHNPNLLGYFSCDTLYRRVWNTIVYFGGKILKTMFYYQFDQVIHTYIGPEISKSDDLVQSVDLVLLQAHPLLSSVRPMLPFVKPVSFLHVNPPKPLPLALKTFLDGSPQGVIYFSFGTMVRSKHMELKMMKTFRQVFDQLNYNVLWKREPDDMENSTSKIMISSWFPQQDILAHKNVKLFISQGGQQSLEEAVDRAVPLLVVPFFYDQFDNAELITRRELGLSLDRDHLSVDNIRLAITEIISNAKYKRNMLRLRQVVNDEAMTPREKMVWWVEYAIRNRDIMSQMRYKGANLPLYQRYFIDVAVVVISILVACFFTLRHCCRTVKTHIQLLWQSIRVSNKVKRS